MKEMELLSLEDHPLATERSCWRAGLRLVAGIDEAGRGALAGPVVAAAVILPPRIEPLIGKVKDSKQLRFEDREELYPRIEEHAISIGVGIVPASVIDKINILQASLEAMRQAVEKLDPCPHLCLVDGNCAAPISFPQRTIVKGDGRVFSIGAASIVAKVVRDRWMMEAHARHPEYVFTKNKGYGTLEHRRAIASIGLSPLHRRSFTVALPKIP